MPASQGRQSAWEVAAQAALAVPGGQALHCSSSVAPRADEKVPGGQGWHAAAALVLPVALPKRPAGQSSHASFPSFAYDLGEGEVRGQRKGKTMTRDDDKGSS